MGSVRTAKIRKLPDREVRELDPSQDPFARESIEHLVKRYGSPLFVIDTARIRAQYRRLAGALPQVDLHYALKPLPHAAVIHALLGEGAFFDLATNGEIDLVRRAGVPPKRCIHTHPIKRDGDIRNALAYGVDTFVIDNPDELRKFVKYRGRASLLIRVSFRSPDAVCDLSKKFGCAPDAVAGLLELAAELRIKIVGLSFHVGSQALDPGMYVHAINVCRELMNLASQYDQRLGILDIGGGFPVGYNGNSVPIEDYCEPIRRALGLLAPGLRVIAEPGRYIAAPAAIAVSSVMGRALRDDRWWYYLDDGMYGSYSGQIYDHAKYRVEALAAPGVTYSSVLAGPTCDSIDIVREAVDLPKLAVGDLIVGREMGAYTWASASDFNFIPRATVLALDQGRIVTERRSA
ncbi:MAG TPA: type III PLP-dependent enzyme [Steroidobacteraceae bacterium]|nr:type III PLP-dependent enzyme [Steroidobacteraceae bacterium]